MADEPNIFTEEPVVAPTIEDLVGEGRKYKDPNELAKAYSNAESFLEKLKRENADLRAFKDLQEANLNNPTAPKEKVPEQVPPADQQNEPPKNAPPTKDVDFRSQIIDTVRELNEQERGMANLDAAAKRLTEIHGSPVKATEAIQTKANELGVSVDWMKETAMRSPDAFYRMMGVQQQGNNRVTPAPSSDVRLTDTSNVRNFEHYDKLRKENPKLYWSREMQLEMQTQAKSNPDFYKR